MLYVADLGRNEILASPLGRFHLPSGRFHVVAGDGKVGFAGDGGPAVRASLNRPQGIAVGADGTLYFADEGNNRIRAVLPNGDIETIAGNGRMPQQTPGQTPELGHQLVLPPTRVPATQIAIGEPTSVAIGPGGLVYFAADSWVMKVSPDGSLSVVDDGATFDSSDPGVMFQQECYPAAIAFDTSTNDLYINCSSPWVMLVQRSDGSLHYLGVSRPHDAQATLTAAPGGGVFAVDGAGVVAYGSGPDIVRTAFGFSLYRLPGGGDYWPQGIAAGSTSLYTDADGVSGVGPPAITAGAPPGPVSVIWDRQTPAANRTTK